MSLKIVAGVCAVAVLAGCGGSGTGGTPTLNELASQFAAFESDPTFISATPQDTVNARRGSARYDGVITIGVPQSSTNNLDINNYYGTISMNVNFVDGPDSVSGTAGNFILFNTFVAQPGVGDSVAGSLSLNGTTTQNNESIGDGITGTMSGAIQGVDSSGTFEGSFTGLSGNGMRLFLDTDEGLGGGVALLVD